MKKTMITVLICGGIFLGITGFKNNELNYQKEEKIESKQLEEKEKKAEKIDIKNFKEYYKSDDELIRIILKDANIPFNDVTSFSINKNYNENGETYYVFDFRYKSKDYTYIISPVDGRIISPRNSVNLFQD